MLVLNKKRYILIRKIIKIVIILFWILTFFTPFLIVIAITPWPVADTYVHICWSGGFVDFSPYPLYWLFFALFLVGFFLSFGNIKTNYKNRIINRNIGNISGMIVLISGIGMSILIQFIEINITTDYEVKIGIGIYFPIIISILIFGETFFLNRVKVISEVKKEEIVKEESLERETREIAGKVFCSSCGAEILDKTGDFCSKCGSPLK